jgi:hypothetical protein
MGVFGSTDSESGTPLAASRSLGAEAPPLGVPVLLGADTAQGTTLAVGMVRFT